MNRLYLSVLGVAALTAPPSPAQTWTGAASGNWSNASNWSPTGVPTSGSTTQLTFDATTNAAMTNDISATLNIFNLNQMTFTAAAPAYTLTGNTIDFLTASGPVPPTIVMNSANAVTISNTIGLVNSLTVNGTGTGMLTLSGTVNNPGTLTYTGAGTLVLAGSNTYLGGTTVNSGVLDIPTIANGSAASPIGMSSNAVGNLNLGTDAPSRGTLLLTGTNAAYSTNRGVTVSGLEPRSGGGAIGVQNAGTTLTWNGQITGDGTLIKTGAGTLVLTNTTNNYAVGAYVEGGTLAAGANGAVFPVGSNVTVQSGATFDLGPYTNASAPANALGSVTLNGGTLRATGATNSDFFVQQINMTGGTIDFTNTPFTYIHVTTAAGITVNGVTGVVTPSTWIGGGTSRIQNDMSAPLTITVNDFATLNAGIILSNGGTNPNFTLTGAGLFRLSNTGNTANITVSNNYSEVFSNDLSTNVGAGAFGTLGSGTFTLAVGVLAYDGPTALTAKPITLNGAGGIYVVNPGVNLTMSGVISESVPGSNLYVSPSEGYITSTVTLLASNTYSGSTSVYGDKILAVPTIGTAGAGGVASPLGASSNSPSNLYLGSGYFNNRGDLLLTGTSPSYTTDRGVSVGGLYAANSGGGIGVQNAGTTLNWGGQITGGGSLIKTGAGALMLANNSTTAMNNWLGGTYIEGGTLTAINTSQIPSNTDVTIFTGGTFNPPAGTNLRTVSASGGTLLLQGNTGIYTFNTLSLTGGTVSQAPGTYSEVNLTGATGIVTYGSAVTSTITFFDFPEVGIQNYSGQPMTIQVAAGTTSSGIDLDLFTPLAYGGAVINSNPTFIKTGAGVLRLNSTNTNASLVVNEGKLRVDNIGALGSSEFGSPLFSLSLTGGTLQYGGPTDTLSKAITLDAGTSGIEVIQAGTTLTLTSPLTGGGGLAIRGAGTLVLPSGSTYGGGTTVDGITYAAGADDSIFGAPSGGVAVINAGTLVYTGTVSTARTFTLNTGGTLQVASGQTLTMTGGRVNGGFLAGPGTFVVTGSTILTGVTTYASTTINQTGAGVFTNFTNGGPLNIAAGLASPSAFTGFTNQGSGAITVGAGSSVNAANFQTYGMLTLAPNTAAAPTILTNTGTSPLYFNGGSETFIGTPQTADPTGQNILDYVDLHGNNAIVAGGLFVNNGGIYDTVGAGTGTIIVDYGALVKGAGFYQNTVKTQNGGKFQTGNSPGSATFGNFVFGPGGVSNYIFAIDDAIGTAGPSPNASGLVSGWGLIKAVQVALGATTTSGNFTWTATPTNPLTVAIDTLVNPTTVGTDVAGPMADFDPTQSYSWTAAYWSGTYSGPTDAATLDADTSFNTSGVVNPIAGTFGWSLDPAGQTLSLVYTPSAVPEPGTLALIGATAIAGWRRRRRLAFS